MKEINLEKIYNECINYSNEIKNPILKEVTQKAFADYKEKLLNKPATPGSHHFYKGGLLYHIYSVTRNSIEIILLTILCPKLLHLIIGNLYSFVYSSNIFSI